MTRDDLLQPSLAKPEAGQQAIYSTTAGYLTAFFGGPFAAVAMAATNSRRLRRLAKDGALLVAATVLSAGALVFVGRPEWFGAPDLDIPSRDGRFAIRVFALLLFGAFWLLHRRYYRGMELMGLEPPNAWRGGIACVIAGLVPEALIRWWLAQ